MSADSAADLATFAPGITVPPRFIPTGNLWVALPEIGLDSGRIESLGVVLGSANGVFTAHGGPAGLAVPGLRVDGIDVPLEDLTWERGGDWLPRFTVVLPHGQLTGSYLAPDGERGVALRLRYVHHDREERRIELTWTGEWASASVEHLRSKPVLGTWAAADDAWTGTRVVSLSAGLPMLALAWRVGAGMDLTDDGSGQGWRAVAAVVTTAGDEVCADVFIGVAPEIDGACTTALHLRRRGFEDLWAATTAWLAGHRLPVPGDATLGAKLNSNLFFNWFYAQADGLDDGRPVLLTSRSPHYYVCAAFWSRDAFCWTFPALLLVDLERSRAVLLASLRNGGTRLPDHALYLNGTSLYSGFELDQAAAPILAIARYVIASADWTVLSEPGVATTVFGLIRRVETWRHPDRDLYATFLLPTDDPTDFPYVTTANALLAAAFDALADLIERARERGITTLVVPRYSSELLRGWADGVRAALRENLVVDSRHGPMWAWASDGGRGTELRDEAPLGLMTLPYWGLGEWTDPVHVATRAWLREDFPHQYEGRYAGAGTPHFPYPSGFDLANRMIDVKRSAPDPVAQFVETSMDQGLACESWSAETGRVTTGAAMASMAGLLVWTLWARLHGADRWDQLPGSGEAAGRSGPAGE